MSVVSARWTDEMVEQLTVQGEDEDVKRMQQLTHLLFSPQQLKRGWRKLTAQELASGEYGINLALDTCLDGEAISPDSTQAWRVCAPTLRGIKGVTPDAIAGMVARLLASEGIEGVRVYQKSTLRYGVALVFLLPQAVFDDAGKSKKFQELYERSKKQEMETTGWNL